MWVDPYERRARLAPGLLALLPLSVAITAFGLEGAPVVAGALAALSLAGGPVVLSQLVRREGLKVQERLWMDWGGAPTTRWLRLTTQTENGVQRDRWREAVELATGVQFPSIDAELADSASADALIALAVAQLRGQTRDSGMYPLIWAENLAYGFERNLYALRWYARVVAALCIAFLGVAWFLEGSAMHVSLAIGVAVNAVILVAWLVVPSRERVRIAADKFAFELLQGAEILARDSRRR